MTRQKLLPAIFTLLLATSIYAEQIDWQKYCIDGIELTGNSDVYYQGDGPRVKIAVQGKSAKEAAGLVDASNRGTVVAWNKGEHVQVDIDLGQQSLILGIIIPGIRTESLEIETSANGRKWSKVPRAPYATTFKGTLMAANLAAESSIRSSNSCAEP